MRRRAWKTWLATGLVIVAFAGGRAAAEAVPLVLPRDAPPMDLTQQATVYAPSPSAGEQMGISVALSGDGTRAVVGGPYRARAAGLDAGAAYVFQWTGLAWLREAMLTRFPYEASDENFGRGVGISGDGTRIVVGAPGMWTGLSSNLGGGQVFVNDGTGWTTESYPLGSSLGVGSALGHSAAISADGTRVVLGAPKYDGERINSGAARVYRRVGTAWVPEAVLEPSNPGLNGYFGWSVAISADGSRLIVGAWYENVGVATASGSAYVFRRDGMTWTQEARLAELAPEAHQGFGYSVAMSGDGSLALVGVPFASSETVAVSGIAMLFARTDTSWAPVGLFTAEAPEDHGYFGSAVALSADGTRALVGGDRHDTAAGADNGYARFFYQLGGAWYAADASFGPSEAEAHVGFSVALSADGLRGIVGAYGDDVDGVVDAGSASIFRAGYVDGIPCTRDDECRHRFCTDGVCCEAPCGGGALDCMACSVAAGGWTDGACTPLRAEVAPTVTCRPVAGPCDVAETCSTDSGACPVDMVVPSSTVCRPAVDACDATERCISGTAACPIDLAAPARTPCGVASCEDGVATPRGECDGAGQCEIGAGADCAPYVCGATACLTACATGADCADGYTCKAASGTCVSEQPTDGGVDGGTSDAGTGGTGTKTAGCGCGAADGGASIVPLLLAFGLWLCTARRRP